MATLSLRQLPSFPLTPVFASQDRHALFAMHPEGMTSAGEYTLLPAFFFYFSQRPEAPQGSVSPF